MTGKRSLGSGMKALAGCAILALTLAACGGGTTPTAATGGASTAPSASGAASTAPSTAPLTAPSASGAASAAPSSAATRTAASTGASAAPATATRAATATAGGATATARGSATAASTSGTRYAIGPNSKATYRVNETFINQGNRFNTAVGTTSAIVGTITIDKQNPSRSQIGTITVDISKLVSDSSQRDNQIRNRWLESSKYPNATFTPKRLEGLPTTPYADGQELTFKMVGDMTIRTVTKEVTFDATGKIVGDLFTGTAATKFNMTDFGFDPPDVAGIVKAENGVEVDLTLEAKQAQ